MTRFLHCFAAVLVTTACSDRGNRNIQPGDSDMTPEWRFEQELQDAGPVTLSDVWARSDGVVFAVGFGGLILRRTEMDGWVQMSSNTQENLTAVFGVENGQRFGLSAPEGEVFAVGWNGTLLHLHPNPDNDAATDDATWETVAGPGGRAFQGLLKTDPFCPDFDGDGIADDGDGDGWWGNAICTGGSSATCDDNCRGAPNGTQRPLRDLNMDNCLGPGDGPTGQENQVDSDGDGVGAACDDTDFQAQPNVGFMPTLFDVWAQAQGAQLTVVAVGEDGAVVSYEGPAASEAVTPPQLPVNDPNAWIAQTAVSFRYDNDCDPATPAGTVCAGAGRLPPSCPAQCYPARTTCMCPPAQGQCCDSAAPTGSGCVGPATTCGPVASGCNAATGVCSPLCPGCFRRLDRTLRGISAVGGNLVAVGARGTILQGDLNDPSGVWQFRTCLAPPPPLDDEPVLTAVGGNGGRFHLVGAAGSIFRYSPGAGGCPSEARDGAPLAFFSSVFAMGGNQAFAVGDKGTVVQINGGATPAATDLGADFEENFQSIWVDTAADPQRLWIVGANGIIVRGEFR